MTELQKKRRNPDWTRDELIIALDLYFRVDTARTTSSNPKITATSQILRSLPIHVEFRNAANFRNAQSVYMKLSNFLAQDPNYKGVGLPKGGKLDSVIWAEFSGDRARLANLAKLIGDSTSIPDLISNNESEDDVEFTEGRIIARLHKMRERSKTLIKKKKAQALSVRGCLSCEVCDFDFSKAYGDLGSGFIECHRKPPSGRRLIALDASARI